MHPTPDELASLAISRGLGEAEVAEACAAFHVLAVPRGEVLIGQDQVASWMGLLLTGGLQVSCGHAGYDEVAVADIEPGDVVGEMGLIGGLARRSTTVRSVAESRLLVLDCWGLARLRRTRPEVAERLDVQVAASLTARLRKTTDAIAAFSGSRALGPARWRSRAKLRWLDLGPFRSGRRAPDPWLVIEHAPALAALSPAERRQLVRSARLRAVPRGTSLIEQGGCSDRGFVLASGEVEVTRQTRDGHDDMLALLTPGSAFGFGSLIDGRPSLATCATAGPSWVLELDREALESAQQADVVCRAAIGAVTRRLGVADQLLGRLMRGARATLVA